MARTGAATARKRGGTDIALLRARVHFDAFLADPSAYVEGVVWRIKGLKLRARHRFSALMGRSPNAYDLWIATREPPRLADLPADPGTPPIAVVVDCRGSSDGVQATLASLSRLEAADVRIALFGYDGLEPLGYPALVGPEQLGPWLRETGGSAPGSRPWVIAIAPGDQMAPAAISAYRAALAANPHAVLLYADDDLVDESGHRHHPHFKPQWNPELFDRFDFLSNSCLFACDPANIDDDWPRSALPLDPAPVHVPVVAHHRHERPLPRLGLAPVAVPADEALPHVSIVVPTRDHVALLRTCMEGLAATHYPSFDITVIDNQSTDPATLEYLAELETRGIRVERYAAPFNYAAMHNAVVPHVAGPLVCLLNNDIEIIDPDWLRAMAVTALRDDVGAVGARLLYPDRTIQHAGIVIGVGGGAGHAHRLQRDDAIGYFGRAHLPQFVSGVTAACLLLRKERFVAVGGFDADNFAVAFNDVDLCLKLNAKGWQSFYEPRACLVHHESKSRGLDDNPVKKARFAGELAALKRIWSTDTVHDPYHHCELSQFGEQFVVRL